MGKYVFGVDVGGTTVKLGLFDIEGNLLDKWEIPTRKENGGELILADTAESIKASVCFARGPFCPQRSSTQAAQHPRMKGTASHSGVSIGARKFAAPVIKMAVGPSAPPITPMPEL